ncbi:hypothetical protein B0H10DRAFT_2434508 [Mycena sp. CBHHK59/15]|nr:hypothetical protein B0H10DRAFT_2434508 [Mycena sp. CBHHK59/15]
MSKNKKKSKGLSSHHRVSYGNRNSLRNIKTIPLNKTATQIQREKEKYTQQLTSLSFIQREELFGHGIYDIDMADEPESFTADNWMDIDSDEEEAFRAPPVGEEGMYHSHAGKEAIFHQIWDKCKPGRGDPRRRLMRVQNMVNSWRDQMPSLVEAYLELKANGPVNSDGCTDAWSIETLGFDERGTRAFVHLDGMRCTNETLLRHAYIGASPEKVSLAFPLRLFEVYRQIHRTCPRFSLDTLSKTLTNLHHYPRRSSLAEQLTTAYDAYLEVIRRVDAHTHLALGRDKSWCAQNACAPCLYKTVNEPALKFSFLACMDGNNSLKLVDSTFRAGEVRPDNRSSTSFRWLTPEQVDVYMNEVAESQKRARSKKKASAPHADEAVPTTVPGPTASTSGPTMPMPVDLADVEPPLDDDGEIAWLNVNELSAGEAEELARCADTCVERWKAAGPEARKKMFALFAIAGIFLCVCRHGHVLVMCDMIRSGELMKYPLAIVKQLLDQYGADIGLGYDIMCAFFKTLSRSSLGAKVTAMRLRGVVPAFHGHAHNRACQIGWHPLYVDGVGLEDFEECERTFALSNHLASTTRLATTFHRQQQIDEHFQFQDLDKHAASGNFIFQNYRQALEKITFNGATLSALEAQLGTTADDYEKDHQTEVKYFQSLRSEPDTIQQTMDYMDWLLKLHVASTEADKAKQDYLNLDRLIIVQGYTRQQIQAVNTRYRTTWTKYVAIQEGVCRFEEEHSIEERWTPDCKEYKDALVLTTERKYRTALAELERLVVSRLFELTKLGMSGIGYKLRDKISKALKTRADAIRRALMAYNDAAATLNPPRERLTWVNILQTTVLAEFDLLRDTRQDIRLQPWTNPARREAMVLYFGIKRAKEEVKRLNVEISRVVSFMYDEHVDYYRAIVSNLVTDPPLATELSKRWVHASRISTSICKRLVSTSRLKGFSGSLFPRQRLGRDPNLAEGVPPPPWLSGVLGVTQMTVEYEEVQEIDVEPDYDERDETDLVIRELEIDEDSLAEFMDRLSTFDDT